MQLRFVLDTHKRHSLRGWWGSLAVRRLSHPHLPDLSNLPKRNRDRLATTGAAFGFHAKGATPLRLQSN